MACREWVSVLAFFNQIVGCAALFRLFEAYFRHFSPPLFFTTPAIFFDSSKNSFSLPPGGGLTNGSYFSLLPGGGLTNGSCFSLPPGGGLTNGSCFSLPPGGGLTNGNYFSLPPGGGNKKHKNIPVCCSGLFGGTSPPLRML